MFRLQQMQNTTRNMSNAMSRGKPMVSVVLDRYIPPVWLPSPFNAANRKLLWERLRKFFAANYAVYKLRKAIKGFKPAKFALEAEQKYVEMNIAFAE